jgi:dipeptidyl-peptidase-3
MSVFPYLVSRSSKEKKYAHYLSVATWAGARIIQGQWTEEAQNLYDMIILIFSENGKLADLEVLKKKSGVSNAEWEDLLQYSSQVRVPVLWFALRI